MEKSSGNSAVTQSNSLARRIKKNSKSGAAILLGAGASKTFGYALTNELLPAVMQRLDLEDENFLASLQGDPLRQGKRNRELLNSYLRQLLPGADAGRNNLPLITSLLSLLDFSLTTGQSVLAGQTMEQTRAARQLLERAILEVIDDDSAFAGEGLKEFRAFARFLKDLVKAGRVGVATTNYDMAADLAVFSTVGIRRDGEGHLMAAEIAEKVDFGFNWWDPEPEGDLPTEYRRPSAPRIQLLKLHGSTNWLRCPLCEGLYINPWGPIWHQAYRTKTDAGNRCDCGETKLEAQIVSPSFVREMRAPNLVGAWRCALDLLRNCDRWIIIGYSFPDEDLAVRALFSRAFGARSKPPQISVVNVGASAQPRYEAFFGRNCLRYSPEGLAPFLRAWTSTN